MREVTVTTVLRRLQEFGDIDPEVLKNKGEIGKDVHSAIEARIRKDWMPLEEERRIAYFASYGKWDECKDIEYKISEKRYYDRDLCLSGQVDAVVYDRILKTNYLLDFKTSAKESFSRCGLSIWNMQAHLYYHLLKKNNVDVDGFFIFLQLKTRKTPEGYLGAKPKEYVYQYDQAIMDRCLEEVHKYWEEFDDAKIFN